MLLLPWQSLELHQPGITKTEVAADPGYTYQGSVGFARKRHDWVGNADASHDNAHAGYCGNDPRKEFRLFPHINRITGFYRTGIGWGRKVIEVMQTSEGRTIALAILL